MKTWYNGVEMLHGHDHFTSLFGSLMGLIKDILSTVGPNFGVLEDSIWFDIPPLTVSLRYPSGDLTPLTYPEEDPDDNRSI